MNDQDVFDESYRKAGKMDCSHFSTTLGDIVPHLIERVRPDLLDGNNGGKKADAELYKLNVYGSTESLSPHLYN